MNLEQIKRNVREIVTEEELLSIVKKKKAPTTYCGYEVSGPVHIGTLVAINKQLDFVEAGLKVKVLLADLHTQLNRKGAEGFIEEMTEYWRNSMTALGLKDVEFILGTEFQFNKEYIHDLLSLALNSTMKRAVRSMQEIARDIEHARVSQVIYPLMQIADIKALDVDIAHGGMEQRKIHMLARELLPGMGHKKPVCIHTPLLSSLRGPGAKMSSSMPETMIKVEEKPERIREKISMAYCPPEKEGNPILQICELIIFPRFGRVEITRPEKFGGDIEFNSYAELENSYLGKKLHPTDLKNSVADTLIDMLEPVRTALDQT